MFRYSSDTIRSPIGSRKENELKTYSCDICEHSKWQNETDVEIHRKEVHKQQLYKSLINKNNHFCRICVRQFADAQAVLCHIKTVHLLSSPTATRIEREIFICETCDHIFFNKMVLSAHIKHVHSPMAQKNIEMIECPVCIKTLKLRTVWSHFLYHKIPSVSTCQICLKNCESKSELREHLKSHPFYYNCDVCGFNTKFSDTFYHHISVHKTNVIHDIGVSYDKVQQYYIPRNEVTWKYNIDPTGLKGLQLPKNVQICVLCREICTDQKFLYEHVLMDHCFEEELKKKHRCVCGEEFFNNVLLRHHIFKLKGSHQVDLNIQDQIINQVRENEEEVNDESEDISDDEQYRVTRTEDPAEYSAVRKQRSIPRNSEMMLESNEIADDVMHNVELMKQNMEIMEQNEVNVGNKYGNVIDPNFDAAYNVEVIIP